MGNSEGERIARLMLDGPIRDPKVEQVLRIMALEGRLLEFSADVFVTRTHGDDLDGEQVRILTDAFIMGAQELRGIMGLAGQMNDQEMAAAALREVDMRAGVILRRLANSPTHRN